MMMKSLVYDIEASAVSAYIVGSHKHIHVAIT